MTSGLEGKLARIEHEVSRLQSEISHWEDIARRSRGLDRKKRVSLPVSHAAAGGKERGTVRVVKRKLRDILKRGRATPFEKKKVIAKLLEISEVAEKRKSELEQLLSDIDTRENQDTTSKRKKAELRVWRQWATETLAKFS